MKTLESLILLAAALMESINRRSYGRQCKGQGAEVMSYVVGTEDGVFLQFKRFQRCLYGRQSNTFFTSKTFILTLFKHSASYEILKARFSQF